MPFIPYFTYFFFQNKLIAYVNQKTTKPLFSEPIPVPKTVVFLQAEAALQSSLCVFSDLSLTKIG